MMMLKERFLKKRGESLTNVSLGIYMYAENCKKKIFLASPDATEVMLVSE